MITVKDINNAPAIVNEKDRNFSFQKIDALKGLHVSFTGYSIGEGEEVYFPTEEQLTAHPNRYLKVGLTQKGGTNKSALIRVNRKPAGTDKTYEGWFNISVLSRMAYDAEGKRIAIDELREQFNQPSYDDYERINACLGKKLVGTGVMSAYAPKFVDRKPVRDDDNKLVMESANYVQVELQDVE